MNEKVQEEEEEEEEEGPWEEVINRKRRRGKITPRIEVINMPIEVINMPMIEVIKQWDSLPGLALLNIFCKSELKDRLQSIPLVCKSWKHVTDDPRCWSSMIPDSVSPEDAFIKNTSGYEFESYELKSSLLSYDQYAEYDLLVGISLLFKEEGEDHDEVEEFRVSLLRLRTLIKKSGGGAAITTLYLSPFSSYPYGCYWWFIEWQFPKILRLIANCCPNLKHISFEAFCLDSTEALLELFNKCKKLELVDLSYYGHNDKDYPLVIQEMGKCLPNLRGIRIGGLELGPTSVSIATYLPQLKLLSLGSSYLKGEHLSVILFSCLKLEYVYVKGQRCRLNYGGQDIVDKASAQIPEFYFEDYPSYWDSWSSDYDDYSEQRLDSWSYHYDDYSERRLESMEDMFECRETDIDDEYFYIRKQRKEDQYVCILKKDENVSMLKKKIKYYHNLKKKERDHECNSRLKKKKKKCQYDSTLRKKKKDQCDYADYVIH